MELESKVVRSVSARASENIRGTKQRHIKDILLGTFTFSKQQGYLDGADPALGLGIPKARL